MKIVCMCGKKIGYRIAQFLLMQRHDVRFVLNSYETPGSWYHTPRTLPISELREEEIVDFNPELIIVAFYDRILKEPLISLPTKGAWNLHLADAERYRGAYPNVWALKHGDTEYGVTLHKIDAGIDTGPILMKELFPLPRDLTGAELYEAMTEAGYNLLVKCFPSLVSGEAMTSVRPQQSSKAEVHYRKELVREVEVTDQFKNAVRALTFPPFPPPYFMIGRRKFIIIPDAQSSQ